MSYQSNVPFFSVYHPVSNDQANRSTCRIALYPFRGRQVLVNENLSSPLSCAYKLFQQLYIVVMLYLRDESQYEYHVIKKIKERIREITFLS